MSSSTIDYFFPPLASYTNEIIATGLFGIGYYLYRVFSDKTSHPQSLPKAKEPSLTVSSSLISLQAYNQNLRCQLMKLKTINAAEILHEIELDGYKPDISTFNTLMDSCFESGSLKQGFWVFEEMKGCMSYVKPDIVTYNILVKGLGLDLTADFDPVLKEMLDKGIKPNQTTFNTILDRYFREKSLTGVLKYLRKMQEFKLEPDFITIGMIYKNLRSFPMEEILQFCEETQEIVDIETLYNVQIEAFFSCGEPYRAKVLISEMKELGLELSAMTYGISLKGFGLYKDIEAIEKIAKEILNERGDIVENEITMGCLIDAFVRCGHVGRAETLLHTFPSLCNNIVIQSTILKGFTKQKNMQKALEVFERMKLHHIEPNLISYNSLLECAIQCGFFEKGKEIFTQIEKSHHPDVITYSSYMKGLLRQGKTNETLELYEALRSKKENGGLDEVLYNCLLDGFVKLKKPEIVLELYEKMKADGIRAGVVTYSILMKAQYLLGNHQCIMELFTEMKEKSIKPSLIIYTNVIQSCVKAKKVKEMIETYSEMTAQQVKPDEVFLNVLISGLSFNNQAKMACGLLSSSLERGLKLNSEVYGNVLRALLKCVQKNRVAVNETVIQGNFTAEEAEVQLLKLSCMLRKYGITIEIGLYNEIAGVLCETRRKKALPRFVNRNLKQQK